jgi:hypothetical protein
METLRPARAGRALFLFFGLPTAAAAQAPTDAPAPAAPASAAAPAPASEPALTPEEQKALEQSLKTDQAAATPAPAPSGGASIQSANPDISLILDFASAIFRGEPMQLGGHDPKDNGFTLQQLELHMGSNVDPFFRLDANLVFTTEGVEVEEAYGTTLALPANLQARAGMFLNRFGRINPTHPHTWNFVDQPLVIGKFFGEDGNRGLGAEVSWLTPLPWYAELVTSAMESDGDCCGRSFYPPGPPRIEAAGDLLYMASFKQFFPFGPSWSLSWGLSADVGPSPDVAAHTEVYGTDLYLRWYPVKSETRKAVSFTAEGLYRRREIGGERKGDWGGYAQAVWNIDPEWEVGARYERVTGFENDPLDPDWTEARQRVSAEATFYPSHFSRIRLQGNYDDPEWVRKKIWAGFLALELVSGAHGAHTF